MDTGSFYSGYGHSSFVPRHGQSSQQNYGGVNHYDPTFPNQISIEQKIERLTKLVEAQVNETAALNNKFAALKDEVDRHIKDYSSCSSSTTPSTPGTSKKLPLELSAAVRHLQDKSPKDLKFAGDKLYSCEQNQKVKDYMVTQLSQQFTNVHSPKKIKRAVHRYFESRRRQYNDSRPARVDIAKKVKHDSRKREARKKLYNSRKKSLKNEKERKMWSEISFEYMSEESSCDETFTKRNLPWRSDALNKMVEKLDRRAEKRNVKKHSFNKKERIQKSPSKLLPPSDAPSWAISATYVHRDATADVRVEEPVAVNTTPNVNCGRRPVARRLQITDTSDSSVSSDSN